MAPNTEPLPDNSLQTTQGDLQGGQPLPTPNVSAPFLSAEPNLTFQQLMDHVTTSEVQALVRYDTLIYNNNIALFPDAVNGEFSTIDMTYGGHFEVHGDTEADTNQDVINMFQPQSQPSVFSPQANTNFGKYAIQRRRHYVIIYCMMLSGKGFVFGAMMLWSSVTHIPSLLS